MSYFKTLLTTFLILFCTSLFAEPKEYLLKEGTFASIGPPFINKDYYLIEIGFVVQKTIKSWDYKYNAYVTAALFEDWKDRQDDLHAGGLGFKGGVLLSLKSSIPLFAKVGAGFAKTVLHNRPVFGRSEQNVAKKDMFLGEIGLLYHFNPIFISLTYQKGSASYFTRHIFFSIGVNY